MRTYDPPAGMSISQACEELLRHVDAATPAQMVFNGITVVANNNDTLAMLQARWEMALAEQQAAYEKTAEYREAQQCRARELAAKQSQIDDLQQHMDFSTLNDTLTWLEAFAPLADDIGVTYDKKRICTALLQAGYIVNEGVGAGEKLEQDPTALGRYIVGQALQCMRGHNMPPHPITGSFIKKWRKAVVAQEQA